MRRLVIFLLALIGLGLLACSDDPVTPGQFAVTLNIADEFGDPVQGVLVNVTSDHPFLPDKAAKGPARKAAVSIQFQIPVPAYGRLLIEDVEGATIRHLIEDELQAGIFTVVWDGKDDEGIHQHSGWYRAHLSMSESESDTVLIEDSVDMLMSLLDVRRAPVGTTDSQGRLILMDKRLFPHLYDIPPVRGTDENGEYTGSFELDGTMRFVMADTARGGGMSYTRMVNGPTILDFVWKPILKVAGEVPGKPVLQWSAPPDDDPIVFELGPVYPNPFN